jgi:hypothetical protein
MTECESIRELLVMHAEGELDPAESRTVAAHLAVCPACGREAAEIDSVRRLLGDPGLFAPLENLTWQLLPRTLADRATATARTPWWVPQGLSSMLWTAGTAAVFVLAAVFAWMGQTPLPVPPPAETATQAAAPGNAEFLDRMQTMYAREATAKYLAQCQDLLIDVVRAEKNCSGDGYDVSTEVVRARDLLARKRMLDHELSTPDVARAKGLCDDLEHFLVNLSTSNVCETQDKIHRMEKYIQRQQLLLRINVLQSELS